MCVAYILIDLQFTMYHHTTNTNNNANKSVNASVNNDNKSAIDLHHNSINSCANLVNYYNYTCRIDPLKLLNNIKWSKCKRCFTRFPLDSKWAGQLRECRKYCEQCRSFL